MKKLLIGLILVVAGCAHSSKQQLPLSLEGQDMICIPDTKIMLIGPGAAHTGTPMIVEGEFGCRCMVEIDEREFVSFQPMDDPRCESGPTI